MRNNDNETRESAPQCYECGHTEGLSQCTSCDGDYCGKCKSGDFPGECNACEADHYHAREYF